MQRVPLPFLVRSAVRADFEPQLWWAKANWPIVISVYVSEKHYRGGVMARASILFLALIAVPAAAAAQVPPTYDGLLAAGHTMYLAGDAAGALAKYGEAKDADSGKPAAYYFIGVAKARLGNVEEAVASFGTAATIAGDKDLAMRAKAMFAAAAIQDAKANWDAAYEAWKKYLEYAEAHADAAGFADTARSRISVIERHRTLETEGAAIRSRADNKGEQN
jgi:tetratricopeptide (TPR) repeat protein